MHSTPASARLDGYLAGGFPTKDCKGSTAPDGRREYVQVSEDIFDKPVENLQPAPSPNGETYLQVFFSFKDHDFGAYKKATQQCSCSESLLCRKNTIRIILKFVDGRETLIVEEIMKCTNCGEGEEVERFREQKISKDEVVMIDRFERLFSSLSVDNPKKLKS